MVYPNPGGTGGAAASENWVTDNFDMDPWPGLKMIQTTENVAKKIGATKEECDAVAIRRYQQYLDALANDRAFQKRYMFPVEVKVDGFVKSRNFSIFVIPAKAGIQ